MGTLLFAERGTYFEIRRASRSLMKRTRPHVVVAEAAGPPGEMTFPLVGNRNLVGEMRDAEKAPREWISQWDGIMRHREQNKAPVDSMGCERLYKAADAPKTQRFQILVSLMLSPQSKDEKTAESMDNLHAAGPVTPERLAAMELGAIEELIKPSGLYRNKAKALKASSQMLLDNHNGDVPDTMADLCKLKGVGPKIAALALSACWQKEDAIGCDIHVTRISQRLGWARGGAKAERSAEQVRADLEEWLPRSLWRPINWALVGFGQTVCGSQPSCDQCPIIELCPSAFKMSSTPKKKKKNPEA